MLRDCRCKSGPTDRSRRHAVVQRLHQANTRPIWSAGACAICCSGAAERLRCGDQRKAQRSAPPVRNCRIHGRRFRLAHIFSAGRVIETATFRPNPPRARDDQARMEIATRPRRATCSSGTTTSSAVPSRTPAAGLHHQRLFYDIRPAGHRPRQRIADLEARLVRTIGDPDIRFREDPVRILRAVKFAARCDLSIESETYRRMMEHKGEIAKCAGSGFEEFFPDSCAQARSRSFELLLGTGLLEFPVARSGQGAPARTAANNADRVARFLGLSCGSRPLDHPARGTPSDALLLAALLLPPLREALHPDTAAFPTGQLVCNRAVGCRATQDLASRLPRPRARSCWPRATCSRRAPPTASAQIWRTRVLRGCAPAVEIVTDAESSNPLWRPGRSRGRGRVVAAAEEALPPDLRPLSERQADAGPARPPPACPCKGSDRPPSTRPPRRRAKHLRRFRPHLRSPIRTPIPSLSELARPVPFRPAFLGRDRLAAAGAPARIARSLA